VIAATGHNQPTPAPALTPTNSLKPTFTFLPYTSLLSSANSSLLPSNSGNAKLQHPSRCHELSRDARNGARVWCVVMTSHPSCRQLILAGRDLNVEVYSVMYSSSLVIITLISGILINGYVCRHLRLRSLPPRLTRRSLIPSCECTSQSHAAFFIFHSSSSSSSLDFIFVSR
jgi:hypothetical protein